MTFTVTIPLWLLVGYPLVGLVLWLPLEWIAQRRIHRPPPFWSGLWRGIKEQPYIPLVVAVAWPWATWEALR